jgi:hypothetical protein
LFEKLDEKHGAGMSNWPPMGEWDNNPETKDTQIIPTENLEGAL